MAGCGKGVDGGAVEAACIGVFEGGGYILGAHEKGEIDVFGEGGSGGLGENASTRVSAGEVYTGGKGAASKLKADVGGGGEAIGLANRGDGHVEPPARRGARRMPTVEVAAWAKAMRARSAPSSVSL